MVYNIDVQTYLTKIICIILLVSAMLLVGAPSISAHSSMTQIADCDAYTCGEAYPLPFCCINADCPIVNNITLNLEVPTNRTISNSGKVYLLSPQTINSNIASVSNQKPFPQWDAHPESLPASGINYRCRNCLVSEEPPLV